MHEPAPQTLIGKTYPDTGVEQGRDVLADLARHPATARHVATKLARHFIADDPPPALVERLTAALPRYRRRPQGGGQGAGHMRPKSWTPRAGQAQAAGRMDRRRRCAPPARSRQIGAHDPARRPCSASRCGGRRRRKGFPDDNAAWIDGLGAAARHRQRLCAARRRRLDPQALLETALGPLASAETRRTVARAESSRRRWRCC